MGKRAIVAGHICIDITPMFPAAQAGHALMDILQPGKLIHMHGVDVHTGGSVANTGHGMKVLGADVRLMGKVGKDEFGGMIRAVLDQFGAGGHLIEAEDCSTSYSVVLAVPGIDRIFLHDPGANDTFRCDDITDEMLEGVDLFHFGYPPLMRSMYENDGAELVKIFKRVKGKGLTTSLDMAAVDPNSDAGKANWREILRQVLPYVDHFNPSVEELCYMLDRSRYDEWNRRADGRDVTTILDVEKDIAPLADELLALGAKNLLIKCGAPGMYYVSGGKRGFQRSFKPKKIVSGTGAGDTSIAAYLTAVLRGCDPEKCVQYAAATGACNVAAVDAISGLKPFETLDKMLAAGWSPDYYPEIAE